jgi:hypothetical protein
MGPAPSTGAPSPAAAGGDWSLPAGVVVVVVDVAPPVCGSSEGAVVDVVLAVELVVGRVVLVVEDDVAGRAFVVVVEPPIGGTSVSSA